MLQVGSRVPVRWSATRQPGVAHVQRAVRGSDRNGYAGKMRRRTGVCIHHSGRRDEEKQGTAAKELMIGKCHAVLDHRHTAGTMSSCPEQDCLK